MLRTAARMPSAWVVVIAFAAFIALAVAVAALIQRPPDAQAACRQQCMQRTGRFVDDKDYPMSAKGQYRAVCRCS